MICYIPAIAIDVIGSLALICILVLCTYRLRYIVLLVKATRIIFNHRIKA